MSHFVMLDELFEFLCELVNVRKVAINGCKSHVRNTVELLELLEYNFADRDGADLLLRIIVDAFLNSVDNLFHSFYGHRPFLARFQNSLKNLVAVKNLASVVTLNNVERNTLNCLVRGETSFTVTTLPSATNTLAILTHAGIDYSIVLAATIWASHFSVPTAFC